MKADQRHQIKDIFECNYVLYYSITCVFQISHPSKIKTSKAKKVMEAKVMVQLVPTLNGNRDLKLVECYSSSEEALVQARSLKMTSLSLWLVVGGTTQVNHWEVITLKPPAERKLSIMLLKS